MNNRRPSANGGIDSNLEAGVDGRGSGEVRPVFVRVARLVREIRTELAKSVLV